MVPCEEQAEMDRKQAAIDRACIIAMVFYYLGFTLEEEPTKEA